MNRFSSALASVGNPSPDLLILTQGLHNAVIESCLYEKDPLTDPAVLLFSMQVSFVTHADFATPNMYDTLVESCRINATLPRVSPREVH
ncbi:hypothetical protein [Herminiimonas sp. CN]|uniref:hypothetical protein n=1 Tax=Herminiimonas sp. CN TaxID=1349818 RepID=UPI000473D6CB|nr:hypothetical protein [Herminiimonas sp. CN]